MQVTDLVIYDSAGLYVVIELENEKATIEQLSLTGETGGHIATVLVETLKVVNDTAAPQWRAAHVTWKGNQLKEEASKKITSDQSNKIIALVANKYNIDNTALQAALSELEDLGVL